MSKEVIWAGLEVLADETLPPATVKFLTGGEAWVFSLDLDQETSQLIARWPENDPPRKD